MLGLYTDKLNRDWPISDLDEEIMQMRLRFLYLRLRFLYLRLRFPYLGSRLRKWST
jgi:hypothetical protein